VLAAALAATALLNWSAVLRGDAVLERITKPTFVLLLLGLAWSLYTQGRATDAPTLLPVLLALGLSLVGDVALLDATEGRFLLGLGAFLLAHVAYVWAVLELDPRPGFPWALLAAVPFVVVLYARVGRHVVAGAGRDRGPVFVYVLVLVVLVLAAATRGDWAVLAGAATFLVSDTILGHDRFVRERPWAPVAVMVTYHTAQVLLVVGLLR
jgi:uncharacterized membrane protein YhhN